MPSIRVTKSGAPQIISVPAGGSVSIAMQPVRTPVVDDRTIAGTAMIAALAVSQPTLSFGVQCLSGQVDLGTLEARILLDVYDVDGSLPLYTITRNVTGAMLLANGQIVYSPADVACFVATLRLTNRKTSAVTLKISKQISGVGEA